MTRYPIVRSWFAPFNHDKNRFRPSGPANSPLRMTLMFCPRRRQFPCDGAGTEPPTLNQQFGQKLRSMTLRGLISCSSRRYKASNRREFAQDRRPDSDHFPAQLIKSTIHLRVSDFARIRRSCSSSSVVSFERSRLVFSGRSMSSGVIAFNLWCIKGRAAAAI